MSDRPYLRSLADRMGILTSYVDIGGVERITEDCTREALLAAMGHDASTEEAAAHVLENLDRSRQRRFLAPVRVVNGHSKAARQVKLTIPGHDPVPIEWYIDLHTEDGDSHSTSGRSKPLEPDHSIVVSLPLNLPPGYHTVHATARFFGGLLRAEQSFVVCPGRCYSLAERLGNRRTFGVWANLYTVRSVRNWGVGDLTDLGRLVSETAQHGAAFVGLNPLHATSNHGERIGPYSPTSRMYRNLLYLDIEAVPEFSECHQAQVLVESPAVQKELERVRSSHHVEYEGVAALKTEILRMLYGTFLERHKETGSDRARAYDEFVMTQGEPLSDFATFCALQAWFAEQGQGDGHWRDWPAAYRSHSSPEVEAFRDAHRREVDFHCYVQFELDRQLAAAAAKARKTGMQLGLYPDLALGSAADGSDAWEYPDLFAEGVEVGAPPDPYSDTGQTWGIPPVDPHRLATGRYDYWVRVLRSAMAHAGMLRIDHVMGLFRQYWVPDEHPATGGAYVRYPAEDLLGILALESQRHGTVIVGEDLGTVPPEVPEALAKWDILSSQVMYFERNSDGGFRPSHSYSPRALVTSTTHDHPPLAGFWTGRDLDIRREIGLISSKRELESANADRQDARAALARRLLDQGLSFDLKDASPEELCEAVYAFLARTPCPVLGVSLDDLAGETRPVNLPGVTLSRYRSWSRRMRRTLDEILADPIFQRVLNDIRARLDHPHPR